MRDRLRRLVARLIDRIPGTCGYTTWRWANQRDVRWPIARTTSRNCRALAVRHGWCPCARITVPDETELAATVRRHPAGRNRGGENRG